MKYKVGDTVQLINKRGDNWNYSGSMDHYIGKIVTITCINGDEFTFKGSDDWTFLLEDIECKVNIGIDSSSKSDKKDYVFKIGDIITVTDNLEQYTTNDEAAKIMKANRFFLGAIIKTGVTGVITNLWYNGTRYLYAIDDKYIMSGDGLELKTKDESDNKLKVGDKVRIREDSEFYYQSQEIGTITVLEDKGYPYRVKFPDTSNKYRDEDLILVSTQETNTKETKEVLSINSNTTMYEDEFQFKVGDQVRIRRDSKYSYQSDEVGVIETICKENIFPYKVTFPDIYNAYGYGDLELVTSSDTKEVLSTNSNTTMYKATAIQDRMNAKFFTDKKLDELTVVTEQIEVRIEQSQNTIQKLEAEINTINTIGNKLNRGVDNKNIKDVEEALKEYNEFLTAEETAFATV